MNLLPVLSSMDEEMSECAMEMEVSADDDDDETLAAVAATDELSTHDVTSDIHDVSVPPGIHDASSESVCRVCGDSGAGMYFGACVCVPCKTFFLRYASDSLAFSCKNNGACVITPNNRTQCKFCRYQKCVEAGMTRRVRPMHVQLHEGQHMCAVCNDVANGIHFGALTCEGCKKFFRRGLVEHKTYSCKADMNCVINPRTRNACRYCRYLRCLAVGMSRDAIQMGRPSKNRLQATASLRQRDVKLLKFGEQEFDENGWHAELGPAAGELTPAAGHSVSPASRRSWHCPAVGDAGAAARELGPAAGNCMSPGGRRINVSTDDVLMTDDRRLLSHQSSVLSQSNAKCEELRLLPVISRQRRSFGSDAAVSDDKFSLSEVSSNTLSSSHDVVKHSHLGDVRNSCLGGAVSVKVEQTDLSPTTMSSSSSSSSHCVSTSGKQYTVSWQGGRPVNFDGSPPVSWQGGRPVNLEVSPPVSWSGVHWQGRCAAGKEQHVLSGGYCCELSSTTSPPATTSVMIAADHFCSTYVAKSSASLAVTTLSLAATSVSDRTCELVTSGGTTLHRDNALNVMSGLSRDNAVSDISGLHQDNALSMLSRLRSSVPVCTAESGAVSVQSPDDGVSEQPQAIDVGRHSELMSLDVSPGSRWHIASDRDSPYVSVMALASTCHLFSESCPSNDDDHALSQSDQSSSRYWLEPDLPDENVIFTEKHCEMINQITAAYDRYVQTGTIINETLVTEMKVVSSTLNNLM